MTKTAGILVNFAVASIIANGGGADIAEEETEPLDEVKDEVLGDSSDGNLTTLSAKEEESDGREGAEDDISEAEVTEEVVEEVSQKASTVTQEVDTTTFEVTAYTAGVESTGKSPGDEGYGITASGAYVKQGRTIACPKSLPFGTVVDIEGFGERVCEDRGSAITEGRIDVYMGSLNEALTFGRQDVEVRIITKGER